MNRTHRYLFLVSIFVLSLMSGCKKQLLDPTESNVMPTNEEMDEIERVLGLMPPYKVTNKYMWMDGGSLGLDIVDGDGQYLHLCWTSTDRYDSPIPKDQSFLWLGTNCGATNLPEAHACKVGGDEETAVKILCQVIARRFIPPELQKELDQSNFEECKKRWDLENLTDEQRYAFSLLGIIREIESQQADGYDSFRMQ